MTRLNQIIALRAGAQAAAGQALAAAKMNLRADEPLRGLIRVHRPLADPGEGQDAGRQPLPPDETHGVQITAQGMLEFAAKPWVRLLDLELTRESANAAATADVVLPGGQVILRAAPVTYLLCLERELGNMLSLVDAMPQLDPAEVWHPDPASGAGVWRSDPHDSDVTRRQRVNWTRHPGDEHHPPQVDVFEDDVPVARRTTTKLSGRVDKDRAAELRDRITALIAAVIRAREEANSAVIADRQAGAALFAWINAGTAPDATVVGGAQPEH